MLFRSSEEPGRQAHTGSGGLRYAAKILYEIMLAGFLCLTKPAFTVEQAAAQALVEEKESESRFRHYGKGPWAAAISALAVVFSLFQMYASTFSAFDAMTLRSWHIIFLLVLSFLMYPAWKGERRSRTRPTLFDALCIAAGLFSFGYLILNYTEITLRGGYFLPVDYFVASVGVIICFEMARRVVGSLAQPLFSAQ